MSELGPLSSEIGERSESANRLAAERCLQQSALLDEVAGLLSSPHEKLAADAAEVLTMVAQQRPDLVAPFAAQLAPLLEHRHTRTRWEAMHALALVTHLVPDLVGELLPRLQAIIRSDKSVIVRDYAVDAVGAYAGTAREAALAALPVLKESLTLWDGKQAARALNGLGRAVEAAPELDPEIKATALPYLDHGKNVVRQAAKRLIKR